MEITEKILEILGTLTLGSEPMLQTVLYESGFGANVRMDRKPDPAAICYILKGFEIDPSSGMRHDKVDVEILFARRCDLNAKGEKIKETLDTIESVVDEFVSLVLDEHSWIVDGKFKVQTAYAVFDCNMVGYSLQFSLVERQGRCL